MVLFLETRELFHREGRDLKKKQELTKHRSKGNGILMKQYVLRQSDMEMRDIYSGEYVAQTLG